MFITAICVLFLDKLDVMDETRTRMQEQTYIC